MPIFSDDESLTRGVSAAAIDDAQVDSLAVAGVDSRAGTRVSQSPDETPTARMKRTLSVFDLTAIGVGGIIGAGIFVLSGQAAARYAGPAVVVSFAISGFGCLLCGLSYSELASMFPVSGSAYAYATAAMGGIAGWLIGWDLTLEYAVGAATVSVGWAGYVCSALKDAGGSCPKVLSSAPIGRDPVSGVWSFNGALFNAPAATVALALTAVAIRGVRETAYVTNALVALKICVLLLFLASSLPFVKSENWQPFFVPAEGERFGVRGIVSASAVVFFSFIGFDAISTASSEARNPQRAVPIATLLSLIICTSLYIAVAFALTGLVSYKLLDVPDPIAVAVDAAGPGLKWVRPIIKFGAIAGLTSVIIVLLNGQARIAHSMATDGLLPAALAYIHPLYKTPSNALLAAGCSAALLAALVPIDALGEMVSIGTLAAFAFVCVGVIVLRHTKPNQARPFRTPFSPFIPAVGALMCFIQMIALPPETWLRLFLWMALGGVFYFNYSRHHMRPIHERIARINGFQDEPDSTPKAEDGATPTTSSLIPTVSSSTPPVKGAQPLPNQITREAEDDAW